MDRIRYEQEEKIHPHFSRNFNYRLLTEEETPEFIKKEPKKKSLKDYGKGRRKRNIDLNQLKDDDSIDEEFQRLKKQKKRR